MDTHTVEPQYDAILRNWHYVEHENGAYFMGRVFDDKKERFKNGTLIHTSLVHDIDEFIVTTSNSVYKLEGEGNK